MNSARFASLLGFAVVFSQAAYAEENNRSNSRPPAATTITLLCKTTIQGQQMSEKLSIDNGKKLVNGLSASFADAMITWTTKSFDSVRKQNILNKHEINMLTGTYNSWSEGVNYRSPPPSFDCEKAP